MTERNSFKLLGQEEERLNIPPPDLEEDIFNQLHILSIFGKTVEMYLPGAINLFVNMLGGDINPRRLKEGGTPQLDKGDNMPSPGGSAIGE